MSPVSLAAKWLAQSHRRRRKPEQGVLTVWRKADHTVAARMLGAIDVFGLWWVWLLALGVAAATGRPSRRYLGRIMAAYLAAAGAVAVTMALAGGS